MENLNALIKPELLALVPALYFLAWMLRRTGKVKSKYIPAVLAVLGVVLAGSYEAAATLLIGWKAGADVVFAGVTQGLICAAAASYAHKLYCQKKKSEKTKPDEEDKEEKKEGKKPPEP